MNPRYSNPFYLSSHLLDTALVTEFFNRLRCLWATTFRNVNLALVPCPTHYKRAPRGPFFTIR